MKSYFAHIWKEDNKTYSVEFPDLPGCFSTGDTFDDAIKNASDALNAYLESCDSRKVSIPLPKKYKKDDMYEIFPDVQTAFAITLKQEREKSGMTQKQAADKMGIKWSAYQRLENPKKTNPTLTTLEKLQKVFSRPFVAL